MEYIRLGDTGLIVSRLSFGAMTFGKGSMTGVNKVNEPDATALVERALEAGVNFFDTANVYSGGQSETILGKILHQRRHEVVISSKAGFRVGKALLQAGLSRQHLMTECEASLKRLDTDYLDIFIVHKTDQFTPLEETLETLNDLVRQGKTRYIGFSNWPTWLAAKAVQMQRERGWARFITSQMYYSLVGRDLEHDFVTFLQDAGVGMMVWSPLAGGFLSGKYTPDNLKDADNRLSSFDVIPFDKELGFKVVDKLREIAEGHHATVAQVALAWMLAQPGVSTILTGASKLAQLNDNLGAVQLKLSSDELGVVGELTRPTPLYPNWSMTDGPSKEALGL